MMNLLEKRSFGDLFGDSFQFFGDNFKHLSLMFLQYAFPPLIISALASSFFQIEIRNPEIIGSPDLFLTPVILFSVLILIFSSIVGGIMLLSFTPIYMKLYIEKGQGNFSIKDMYAGLRSNIFRVIKLFFASILILIPLGIAVGISAVILIFTIVGIMLPIGFLLCYYSQIWFFHIDNPDNRSFGTLGDAFDVFKNKRFWKVVGASTLMILLVTIFQMIITSILMLGTGGYSMLLNPNALHDLEKFQEMEPILIISQTVSYLISYFVGLIMYIQQGLIYYSYKEEEFNITEYEDISRIGE
jgi:hypothetical protein